LLHGQKLKLESALDGYHSATGTFSDIIRGDVVILSRSLIGDIRIEVIETGRLKASEAAPVSRKRSLSVSVKV
jgi:hypothetical protein